MAQPIDRINKLTDNFFDQILHLNEVPIGEQLSILQNFQRRIHSVLQGRKKLTPEIQRGLQQIAENVSHCLEQRIKEDTRWRELSMGKKQKSGVTALATPFEILPRGTGYEQEETSRDTSHERTRLLADRIQWTIDLATVFEPQFHDQKCFYRSPKGYEGAYYHAVLFPTFHRCVFVCNKDGRATYLVPLSHWEEYAQRFKVEELREMAMQYLQHGNHVPAVAWFPMLKNEYEWKSRLLIELQEPPVMHPRASSRETQENQTSRPYVRRPFQEWVYDLIQFLNDHHGTVPSRYSQNILEKKLSDKLRDFRTGYRNYQLQLQGKQPMSHHRITETQIQQLLALGITLDTESKKREDLETDLIKIQAFLQEHKRLPYPRRGTQEERDLGARIKRLREAKHNEELLAQGEKPISSHRLPPDMEKMVLAAGLDLQPSAKKHHRFEEDLRKILAFQEQHGRLPNLYPKRETEKPLELRLHHWKQAFRNLKKLSQGKIPGASDRLTFLEMKKLVDAHIILSPRDVQNGTYQTELQRVLQYLELRDKKNCD